MRFTRKMATALSGTALAPSGVLLTAPVAHADTNSCLSYLESQGYTFKTEYFHACYHGHRD